VIDHVGGKTRPGLRVEEHRRFKGRPRQHGARCSQQRAAMGEDFKPAVPAEDATVLGLHGPWRPWLAIGTSKYAAVVFGVSPAPGNAATCHALKVPTSCAAADVNPVHRVQSGAVNMRCRSSARSTAPCGWTMVRDRTHQGRGRSAMGACGFYQLKARPSRSRAARS